jgi:hypothetical protein
MKSLFVLGALLLATMRASAQPPIPPNEPPPEPKFHTMTVYDGCKVVRMTWVWENGAWHALCNHAPPSCEPPAPHCRPDFAAPPRTPWVWENGEWHYVPQCRR